MVFNGVAQKVWFQDEGFSSELTARLHFAFLHVARATMDCAIDGRTTGSRGDAPIMRSSVMTVQRGPHSTNPGGAVTAIFERLIHPQWAAIPLRLIVGYGFMEHGYAKLIKGPAAFVSILHALGVPYAHAMAWLTILIELLGGFTVLIGAFIPLISVPLAGVLLVAMITVHLRYGFGSIKLIAVTPAGAQFGPPGYECDLLYLACLAALVLIGSGPFSVDGLLSRGTARHDDQRSRSISPSSHSLRRK